MRILLAAASLAALGLLGCSGSNRHCSPDAGDGLVSCTPFADGGAAECAADETCAPFGTGGLAKCMKLCNATGSCADPTTICSAIAAGNCTTDAGTNDDDGGKPTPTCVTVFACYPNRC
jgi:hypothetical protein